MNQFDKDMTSPYRELFLEIREYLISEFQLVETRKPRITTYSNADGSICHLRTMPQGVDIGFLKGAKMIDDHNRLSGNGKVMRVLSVKQFEEPIFKFYLDQAIELNR